MPQLIHTADLSHPIHTAMPVFPGDPEVTVWEATSIEADGFNVLHLNMGSQSGTHIDAPLHFVSSGASIDQIDISTFVGPAVLVDCRGLEPDAQITPDVLPKQIAPGSIVVFHTGWDQFWGSETYFAHPYLHPETASVLARSAPRALAIDALSIDSSLTSDHGFVAHHLILGEGIPVAENLRGLQQITWPDPWISLLPLRLAKGDGAPIRAIAMGFSDHG